MAVRLIWVRNKRTGAKALIAETALPHLPDYVRTARQERADADATPAKATTTRKAATRKRSTPKKAASAAQNKE